jgi:hypothetical protein
MPYKDKEKQKEYFKNYYYKNREKKLKARKDLYNKTPYDSRLAKNSSLKHRYKISVEEYENKLKEQNYRCAICNRHRDHFKRNLSVDHNHKTGKIRGLLCVVCNTNVGVIEEKIEPIQEYLKKHKEKLN